ncbi:MAG: hypothetical protein M0C28_28020 [Candidatus Moduliflexus flocculans]|nr:hypothetical protein [Candidatus Moduliflexus flocculans]
MEPPRQRGRALPLRVPGRSPAAPRRRRARPSARGRRPPLRRPRRRHRPRAAARDGTGRRLARGAAYGLGGFLLSTVNLLPLFQASAWAPWVVAAMVGAAREPSPRRTATLAVLAALQVSTLAAEIVVQTAAVGLVLLAGPALRRERRGLALAAAAVLAGTRGARAARGTGARGRHRARARVPGGRGARLRSTRWCWRKPPSRGSSGTRTGSPMRPPGASLTSRPATRTSSPSTWVSPSCCWRRGRGGRRVWGLVAAGVLLALGSHGPLGLLPEGLRSRSAGLRSLFFLAHLGLALLAGLGLERALRERGGERRRLMLALPGAALVLLALAFGAFPAACATRRPSSRRRCATREACWSRRACGRPRGSPPGRSRSGPAWPSPRGPRRARGGSPGGPRSRHGERGREPARPASFYDLRSDVAPAMVRSVAPEGRYRFFSYGVAYTPGLVFEPVMARASSDAWLFYLDRQTLLPRTSALDGLERVRVDRTGWSPPGSTLAVEEAVSRPLRRLPVPTRGGERALGAVVRRAAGAGARRRAEVKLPEVVAPLGLYELVAARPRASWVPGPGGDARQAASVVYEPIDAHTVRVRARDTPGILVVRDGHHPDWEAEDSSGPVPVLRAGDRYRGIPTGGGEQTVTMRFRPGWRTPALLMAVAGALVALFLAFRR